MDIERLILNGSGSSDDKDFEAFSSLVSELSAPGSAGDLETFRAFTESAFVAVRRERGTIVGCASLVALPEWFGTEGYLSNVVVEPAWRGRGIARAMLLRLHAHARERGFVRIRHTSNEHRVAAHRLYESLGYAKAPTHKFHLKL